MDNKQFAKDELIVLVHGFFKNKRDMIFLQTGLGDCGYDLLAVNLPTTFGSISDCCQAMQQQLRALIGKYAQIHFIAHSMGGLIVRAYVRGGQFRVGKCIFIATPHRGSKLADVANNLPYVAKILRPLTALTTSDTIKFHPLQGITIGIIAGTNNNLLAGKIFLSSYSDGRVEVTSVKSADMSEFLLLPLGHREIHRHPRTLKHIKSFLQTGSFRLCAE